MTLVQRTRNLAPASITQIVIAMLIAGIGIALALGSKPWQIGAPNKIWDFVRVYSWWAGLINILPLAVLLLTARKWVRTLRHYSAPRVQRSTPSGFRATVLGAMLVCAVFGAMRLGLSLWDDEEFSVHRAILGTYRTNDDGTVKLKELPWSSTLWYYTKPTNHIFQSILSRLSLSTWRAIARPRGLQLNETAVRFPSYVAGIFSVAAIALLMARVGFPWAGALGAWLLAIHPGTCDLRRKRGATESSFCSSQ
jgi:predicted secreted protein